MSQGSGTAAPIRGRGDADIARAAAPTIECPIERRADASVHHAPGVGDHIMRLNPGGRVLRFVVLAGVAINLIGADSTGATAGAPPLVDAVKRGDGVAV